MKCGVIILVVVALAGCSREGGPTAPAPPAVEAFAAPVPPVPPPPTGTALLWVMVVNNEGACIEGATIQIIGAEGAGDPVVQQTPCDIWSYDGGVGLGGLAAGALLTIRGAAPGFVSREAQFRAGSNQVVFVALAEAPSGIAASAR